VKFETILLFIAAGAAAYFAYEWMQPAAPLTAVNTTASNYIPNVPMSEQCPLGTSWIFPYAGNMDPYGNVVGPYCG
jgi:hypothetical protein